MNAKLESVSQADIVPFLQQVFMPIVSKIFEVLAVSVDERDQVTQGDRKMLHRGYFTFISTLVTNNVAQVLSNQSRLICFPLRPCCWSIIVVRDDEYYSFCSYLVNYSAWNIYCYIR